MILALVDWTFDPGDPGLFARITAPTPNGGNQSKSSLAFLERGTQQSAKAQSQPDQQPCPAAVPMLNFGGNPPAPLPGLGQRHSHQILETTAPSSDSDSDSFSAGASSSSICAFQDGACAGRGHNASKLFIHKSFVGQPLSSLTSSIFDEAAADAATAAGAR
ncbi:hypothetical protein VaNZ11_008017, partial [Volvox africanus]